METKRERLERYKQLFKDPNFNINAELERLGIEQREQTEHGNWFNHVFIPAQQEVFWISFLVDNLDLPLFYNDNTLFAPAIASSAKSGDKSACVQPTYKQAA